MYVFSGRCRRVTLQHSECVRYGTGGDAVGMTQVCQHGYTVCIKPDSNREPGQEVLVPHLAMSRSQLVVLTEQHDFPLRGREFALDLILMDPCIIYYSVEIPTRCSFVIEFIIPEFFKGSTCFERHTAHHQEL